MPFTREQLKERYAKLPKEIKEVLDSEENTDRIYDLGNKNKLHIDKIGLLNQEINLVMLGMVKPQEFVPNLREKLKISDEEARQLAMEVNEQIFAPIRESLKQVHAMGEREKEEPAKPIANSSQPKNANPLDQYLATDRTTASSLPTKPYVHDPYHEPVE